MTTTKKLLQAAAGVSSGSGGGGGGGGGGGVVQDFFSVNSYTGNGTTTTITNGVDLTSSGMVLHKRNSQATDFFFGDTVRGGSKEHAFSGASEASTGIISSFNSDGYTLNGTSGANQNTVDYTSYTFKDQAHFFKVFQYTGNGTTQEIAHGLGSVPGLLLIKASGNWRFWHNAFLGTSKWGYGNLAITPGTSVNVFGNNTVQVNPTSSVFTVGSESDVNGNGTTYTVYAFGHNSSGSGGFGSSGSEDVVACGTYTGNGSTDGPEIVLGFQPQLFLFRNISAAADWYLFDSERGLTAADENDPFFKLKAEAQDTGFNIVKLLSNGIKITFGNHGNWNATNNEYAYMAIRKPMPVAASAGSDIEDIFSIDQYLGNASTNVITNGVDLTSGGMVLHARPTASNGFYFTDTIRGGSKEYLWGSTGAELTTGRIASFNNNGYTLNGTTGGNANVSGNEYISYTFKNEDNFFKCFEYTGNGTTQAITHGLGSTPGMIVVKNRAGGHWSFWHKGFAGTSKWGYFNNTITPSADNSMFGNNTSHVDPTSTHFTVGDESQVNSSGATYTCYVFGDNNNAAFGETGDQDVIKCGTFVGSSNYPFIDLGFEPQFFLIRNISAAGNWNLADTMRGLTGANDRYDMYIKPATTGSQDYIYWLLTSGNGIKNIGLNHSDFNQTGSTFAYVAIRTSGMGTPTDVDDVFHIGDTTNGDEKGGGFKTDLHYMINNSGGTFSPNITTRSITTSVSGGYLSTINQNASRGGGVDLFSSTGMETTGITGRQYLYFARAKGFLDIACHSGDGNSSQVVPHGLQTVPEMIWSKSSNSTGDWIVYHKDMHRGLGGVAVPEWYYVTLNYSGVLPKHDRTSSSGAWNYTAPTATDFTVGSLCNGATTKNHISYLWGSVDGISKVGSYTGTGSAQNIDCGFSAGARYVMIRSIDSGSTPSAGTMVFDTRRGIVAGSDPFYSMGTELLSGDTTNKDMIDPHSSGFALNNVTGEGADLNVSGKHYIFLAIA